MFGFFKYGSVKIVGVVFLGLVTLAVTLIVHSYNLRVEASRNSHSARLETIGVAVANNFTTAERIWIDHWARSSQQNEKLIQSGFTEIFAKLDGAKELYNLPSAIGLVSQSENRIVRLVSQLEDGTPGESGAHMQDAASRRLPFVYHDHKNQNETWISAIVPIESSLGDQIASLRVDFPFHDIIEQEQGKLINQILLSLVLLVFIGILMVKIMGNVIHQEAVHARKLSLKSNIIEQKHDDMTASIQYARKLQSAFKPNEKAIHSSFSEFFNINMPKDIIGGDFFWFHDQPSANTKIVVQADCTGHGVPGAMMSVLGNTLLSEIVVDYDVFDPAMILELMNKKLMTLLRQDDADSLSDGMDISVCALNTETGELVYAGANQSILLIREGELVQFKGNRHPIGGFHFELERQFSNRVIKTKKGDKVYMYTDGFKDQFGGEKGKRLKRHGFKNMILETSHENLKAQHQQLLNMFSLWKGAREQVDDVSLVGFKIA